MWRSNIIGRKEMSAEMVQTISSRMGTDLTVIIIIISQAGLYLDDLRVIQCVYWRGSLILMYLSSAIMHRLSMEAVEHITSQLRSHNYRFILQHRCWLGN